MQKVQRVQGFRAVKGLLAALILLCADPALAQQPFSTDDADVTPPGGVHVEPSRRDRQQLQVLVGNSYGVTNRVHVSAAVIAGHFMASPRAGIQVGLSVDLPR